MERAVISNADRVIFTPLETAELVMGKIQRMDPSKLIDYLGANRPIFGITPSGAAAGILEAAGESVAVPSDPHMIAEDGKRNRLITNLIAADVRCATRA